LIVSQCNGFAPAVVQRHVSTCAKMFTGIVEEMGSVVSLESRDDMTLWDGSKGSGTELTVENCPTMMEGAYLGCSICVSGVCLTATELDMEQKRFKVGLAPETLRKTYLGELKAGDKVNLERASEIGGRNSGHFVQGHVDGVGIVADRWIDEDSLFYKIQLESALMPYVVPKGFIAIDGTSLTVCEVDMAANTFTFMLVEYTQKKIIVPAKLKGDKVNIEVDVLGKYSHTAVQAFTQRIEALEAKVKSLEEQLANQ